MNKEIGFAMPKEALGKYFRYVYAMGALTVLVQFLFKKSKNPLGLIEVEIAMFLILAFIHFLATKSKCIYVSQNGLRGFDRGNRRVEISWIEIASVKKTKYKGIDGVQVVKQDETSLVFPLAIAASKDFKEALVEYAPDGFWLFAQIE